MNEHLLSMHDLTADDVTRILDTAESLREVGTRVIKKVPALRGRTVVNFFLENSTRTRISFELAAKRLSADVINFSSSGSSGWVLREKILRTAIVRSGARASNPRCPAPSLAIRGQQRAWRRAARSRPVRRRRR